MVTVERLQTAGCFADRVQCQPANRKHCQFVFFSVAGDDFNMPG
jgi:hypothetical protein